MDTHLLARAAGCALSVGLASSAGAQCEIAKLVASDAQPDAGLGHSIAVAGERVLVGASSHGAAGAAYLFDLSTGVELYRVAPADLAPDAQFGSAVALSEGYAVVAAVLDAPLGQGSGSVYVFDAATGQELHKLVPSDGGVFDLFGISLAISGPTVAVGADGYDNGPADSGAAYLFDAASGIELALLLASDPEANDRFGGSVAIDGDRVLVGAWNKTVGARTAAGAAYLFDTSTGHELARWTASDGGSWDYFGQAVALAAGRGLVGAPRSDALGINSGAAYLFDVATGAELAKVTASDGASHDFFGQAVALDGDLAAIGAPFHDGAGAESGRAYVLDVSGAPAEILQLVPADAAIDDTFGVGIDVSGTRVVAGAAGHDGRAPGAGAAYAFVVAGSDCNGNGIADGCDVAGGASLDGNGNGIPDECEPVTWRRSPVNGHWYALTIASNWAQAEQRAREWGGHLATVRSSAEDGWIGATFGVLDVHIGYTDVFVEGTFEWISGEPAGYESWAAGQPDGQPGAADFCVRGAGGGWRDEAGSNVAAGLAEVESADCDADLVPDVYEIARGLEADWNGDGVPDSCVPASYCPANVNSSGAAASIGALGSPEIADDDFTLVARDAAANEFGYFLMSLSTGFVPLFGGSEGNLCLGAPVVRINKPPSGDVVFSGPSGTLAFQLSLGNLPQGSVLHPGDVWHFQCWFRDGASSNTSDAITVLFR